MTPKALARVYLRYWFRTAGQHWELSGNTPAEFYKFVVTLPDNVDRSLVYEALRVIATIEAPAVPDTIGLLAWLQSNPRAIEQVDRLLNHHKPPKSTATLLRSAYLAEVQVAKNAVYGFLQLELAKY